MKKIILTIMVLLVSVLYVTQTKIGQYQDQLILQVLKHVVLCWQCLCMLKQLTRVCMLKQLTRVLVAFILMELMSLTVVIHGRLGRQQISGFSCIEINPVKATLELPHSKTNKVNQ